MVGSKVARACPPRKIKVKDMICDMSEAYKIPMVSMSKRLTNSRKLKGLDTTLWKHKGLLPNGVSEVE